MTLADYVNTFGQTMLSQYGERIHKLAIHAGFTCPNRDGTKGRGGCTFCNNRSFTPGVEPVPVAEQIEAGRKVLAKRTGARRFIAYFQAYTNTYADVDSLRRLYDEALSEPDVLGLAIGTRPDCVPAAVLDLLMEYQNRGYEIWLELGLQSSFDATLKRVNRGHDYVEYRQAVCAARSRGLRVCTHLIIGLPGEGSDHVRITLARVLADGVDGLKFHPLHVVKGTALANSFRKGEYEPCSMEDYVRTVCDLVEATPMNVVFHRLTGTATSSLLIAPAWCGGRWRVLNAVEDELSRRGRCQGSVSPDNLWVPGEKH